MDLETAILDENNEKISITLVGQDGNAFSILAICDRAMKEAKVPQEARKAFYAEATSGDYDNLLQTAMKYFNVF